MFSDLFFLTFGPGHKVHFMARSLHRSGLAVSRLLAPLAKGFRPTLTDALVLSIGSILADHKYLCRKETAGEISFSFSPVGINCVAQPFGWF